MGAFTAPEAVADTKCSYHPAVDVYGLGLIYNYMYGLSHSQSGKYVMRPLSKQKERIGLSFHLSLLTFYKMRECTR